MSDDDAWLLSACNAFDQLDIEKKASSVVAQQRTALAELLAPLPFRVIWELCRRGLLSFPAPVGNVAALFSPPEARLVAAACAVAEAHGLHAVEVGSHAAHRLR